MSKTLQSNQAAKYGRRNAGADQKRIQQIHDLTCEMDAECKSPAKQLTDKASGGKGVSLGKTIAAKCIELGASYYAQQEAWDVCGATMALYAVAQVAADEAMEQDADAQDLAQLAGVMRDLIAFIEGEIDEMEGAAEQAQAEAEAREAADSSLMLGMEQVTKSATTPPAARVTPGKTVGKPAPTWNFNYIKSLRLSHDEQFFKDVLAVKFIGKDDVKSYSMLWGDPRTPDLETDFFTKSTNFWDGALKGMQRPLTFDHGQDPATKEVAVIGTIGEYGDDELGRWYAAQLDRAHAYRKMIDRLIGQKALGSSSDSAPQYVIREPAGRANFIKQWPWFATAFTTTPCEPRMLDAGLPYWKATGIDMARLPNVAEQLQEAAGETARLAALSRDLDLLKLHV